MTVGKTVTFPKFFNFEMAAVKPLQVTTGFAEKVSPTKIQGGNLQKSHRASSFTSCADSRLPGRLRVLTSSPGAETREKSEKLGGRQ